MENTFEKEAPTEILARVHDFARDLAYGAALGLWHTQIYWLKLVNPEISHHSKIFRQYLGPKWGENFPSEYLLLSFGYFQNFGMEAGHSIYLLTDKAFHLLEKPVSPPNVFISYRRSESSAFGLLVEARLRLAGNPNPFIDKNLVPGDEWSMQLREHIERCRYFVCLVGKTTLESAVVLQEIAWADQAGCAIISIWHNGARVNEHTPDALKKRHAIIVIEENALEYETAINQVLNSMGYSTY